MIEDLQCGMKLWGQVTGTQVYGIFIDLGVNENGLLHKSQLSHHDLIRLETTFPQGSWVEVEILKVDLKKGHIELRLSTTN